MKMYFLGFDVLNAKTDTPKPSYSKEEMRPIKWWGVANLTCVQLISDTGIAHFLEKYFGHWIIYKFVDLIEQHTE